MEPNLIRNNNEAGAQANDAAGGVIPPNLIEAILRTVNVRMLLSSQERQWALAIKAAILACDDLEPLSDMMYAQLALKDGDNVQSALQRARHLQLFRQEYEISDNFEEACAICKTMLQNHRGHILALAHNANDGNYVIIYDQARGDLGEVLNGDATGRAWRIFLASGWYLYHALTPDFLAMRYEIDLA